MEANFDIRLNEVPTQVEKSGCYTSDDSPFEILEKNEILLQDISGWSFLVIISILTVIMIFAGV